MSFWCQVNFEVSQRSSVVFRAGHLSSVSRIACASIPQDFASASVS